MRPRARGSTDDLSLLVCDLRDGAWPRASPGSRRCRRRRRRRGRSRRPGGDDFAFDEGVAESKAEAPRRPSRARRARGSFGGVLDERPGGPRRRRLKRAAEPAPAPGLFAYGTKGRFRSQSPCNLVSVVLFGPPERRGRDSISSSRQAQCGQSHADARLRE